MYSEEKDNKKIYILVLIFIMLLSILLYFLFFNKCKCDCDKCEKETVEVEPKYQLINYSGLTFKMPLDWNFVNKEEDYSIIDSKSRIFINMEIINESYELFITDEYQVTFLEGIQTSDNIKIDKSKQEDNYYVYEGSYNNYKYLIIAINDYDKVVLVGTKFVDLSAYNKEKKNVIDFSLSSILKSEE